jgi:hypothetical protein
MIPNELKEANKEIERLQADLKEANRLVDWGVDQNKKLSATVEQLQAERERPAKTADGVPVYVDMVVYYYWREKNGRLHSHFADVESILNGYIVTTLGERINLERVFSTPAARDAAEKEKR